MHPRSRLSSTAQHSTAQHSIPYRKNGITKSARVTSSHGEWLMCGNHSPFQKKTQKKKKSARQIACCVSAADAHAIQTETWLVTLGNPAVV